MKVNVYEEAKGLSCSKQPTITNLKPLLTQRPDYSHEEEIIVFILLKSLLKINNNKSHSD